MIPPFETTRQTAAAKINLSLHVTARRNDGYHLLDSLVAFADAGDRLSFMPAEQTTLECVGPFAHQLAAGGSNIVLAAACALQEAWPGHCQSLSIQLDKKLPVSSGIGGGSADAAAVLRAMASQTGVSIDAAALHEVARQLGADVPVCVYARTCRMGGIGDKLDQVTNFPSFPALLINPGIAVSTPQIFDALGLEKGQAGNDRMPDLPASALADGWISWLVDCRNDLQAPAIRLVPEIDTVLAALDQVGGCLLHRMSGSGATCFGLFEDTDAAHQAANRIGSEFPQWWVCETSIG